MLLPALCLVLGGIFLVAGILGGQLLVGITSLVVMVAYAAVLVVFGARSDLVSILRGRPVDERLAAFTLQATASAGSVAIVIALGAYVWEIAHGRDGMGYVLILVPTAVAFFGSLVWQRARG
jgi:hypothetical protein